MRKKKQRHNYAILQSSTNRKAIRGWRKHALVVLTALIITVPAVRFGTPILIDYLTYSIENPIFIMMMEQIERFMEGIDSD